MECASQLYLGEIDFTYCKFIISVPLNNTVSTADWPTGLCSQAKI